MSGTMMAGEESGGKVPLLRTIAKPNNCDPQWTRQSPKNRS